MNINFSLSKAIRSLRAEEDFSVAQVDASYGVGTDATATQTLSDITYNIQTTTGTRVVSDLNITKPLNAVYGMTATSETPTVCTVDDSGKVSAVATSGTCSLVVSSQHTRRRFTQAIQTIGATTLYSSIASYSAGSLRKYLYDQQAAALVGVTPGATAQRAGVYGNGIAAGLNTAVAMGGSYGGANPNNFIRAQGKAGFAGLPLDLLDQILDSGHSGNGAGWRAWISPNHFLTWRGHGATDGATWRAIGGELIVEYSATAWTGSLAKLLPANYATKANLLSQNWANIGTGLSCWARLFNTYDNKGDSTAERRWVQPVEMHRCAFTDSRKTFQVFASNGTLINVGDSGSPIFCGVAGTLVMLSHAQTLNNIGSIFYADYISEINAAMAALNASGTFTVQTVDLSGFTTYP